MLTVSSKVILSPTILTIDPLKVAHCHNCHSHRAIAPRYRLHERRSRLTLTRILCISFPAKFEMRCKTCGTIHSYALGDVEDFQSDESLPLGFEIQAARS